VTIGFPWMSRSDRRRWTAAASLANLGDLTAGWLVGDIASHPGDQPNYGRKATSLPLIATLAACNRGGYLTEAWQVGADPRIDAHGQHWQKRAAVVGYVKDPVLVGRLVGEAGDAGLEVLLTDGLDTAEAGTAVTFLNGESASRYGAYASPIELRATWSVIGGHAISDLIAATRVTLTTKEWGTDAGHTLWQFLDQFFGNTDHPYAAPAASTTSPRLRVPGRASRYLLGLARKTWAYASTAEVKRELDRINDTNLKHWNAYQTGAARLRTRFDFQPGLLSEVAHARDAMLFVRSFAQAAHSQDHHDLGDRLTEAEEALATAMQRLGDAALATTEDPAPEPAATASE
jgi:hypothetical protein